MVACVFDAKSVGGLQSVRTAGNVGFAVIVVALRCAPTAVNETHVRSVVDPRFVHTAESDVFAENAE